MSSATRLQVRVEVAAEHVAQQRAQVTLDLGHELARGVSARPARGPPPITKRSRAIAASTRALHQPRAGPPRRTAPPRAAPRLASPGVAGRVQQRPQAEQVVGQRLGVRARSQPISNRPSAHATCCGGSARSIAVKNSRRPASSPLGRNQSPAAPRRAPPPNGSGCQRPVVGAAPAGRAQRDPPRRPQAQRADHARRSAPRPRSAGIAVVGRHVALEHAQHGRLAVAVLRPDRLGRRVGRRRAPAPGRRRARPARPRSPRRAAARPRARGTRVAVQRPLDLDVDALEALLGEAEAGRVLVEALEHRPQRGLGLLAAAPPPPFTRSHGEAPAPSSRPPRARGGQLAQPRPALVDERAGARLVAVQGRAAAAALVDHVELDLGAVAQFVGEQRGGLEREVPQRVVESTVAHAGRFRRRGRVSCRGG